MGKSVAYKLLESHLVDGEMKFGQEIGLKVDQTLTQDATGTMVMLELEAMGCDKVKTEVSAQYVDHNLLQTDFKNADDHVFLQSACAKFGVWFSKPGNGVSHPVHMERLGVPGKILLGADSHTCAAGSLGMLAIGAGGLEVAIAAMGKPFYVKMPQIWGVKLTGSLPDWVSAKDVILEMLRRHGVAGGRNKIIEYYGPGLDCLSAMDRHVIANMGAELGATSTVFPSDKEVKRFLETQDRGDDWVEILPDSDADYDLHEEINLSELEPLIACPNSPGNVVPVREVAGKEVYQCMVGSSANPAFRDFVIPAMMVQGKKIHPRVSFDINPTSEQVLENLVEQRYLTALIKAGARIHQPGCNGCIGMGQAPATDKISLRTVPRNFPGRSGTDDDLVYLCSPETAAASALTGIITDPRTLGMPYPKYYDPAKISLTKDVLIDPKEIASSELIMGPNIKVLPDFGSGLESFEGPALLKAGDDVSTDEILPAGTKVLPFRSNIPEISRFSFCRIDENFYDRAQPYKDSGLAVIGGENYGQGSSREHAVIAPRYLGLRIVIAKSYARIHRKNLTNFGIPPLMFKDPSDYDRIDQDDILTIENVKSQLDNPSCELTVRNKTKDYSFTVKHDMSARELELVKGGGYISLHRSEFTKN